MPERVLVKQGKTQISCLVSGTGPAIVLVHGSSASAEGNWSALMEYLSGRWRLIAPDLPGSGRTDDSGGRLELQQLADCVSAVVAAEGLTSFHLVGYSLGAAVAATLAAQQPDKVRAIVLLAGWVESKGREQFQFDFWQRMFRADRELFARYMILSGFSPAFYASASQELLEKAVRRTVIAEGSARQSELNARLNIRAALPSIKCPTLVIGLRDDKFLPPAHSREVAAAIPSAEYVEVDGGHLFPFENPGRLAELIEPFLSKVATS